MTTELNGARALTPAQFAAQHPQEDASARTKQAERGRQAEEDRAGSVIGDLLGSTGRGPDELAALLGEPEPEPPATLEQVLQAQAANLLARNRPPTEVLAELQRIRAQWTPVELVVPTYRYEPRTWLVENLIPLGLVGVLNGPGDAGKSTLALQLAYELAKEPTATFDLAGYARGGFEDRPRRSVVACYEDDLKEVNRRLYRINALSDKVPPDRAGRLRVIPRMSQHGPLWAADGQAPGEPTVAWNRILHAAAAFQADLLILDPLAALYLDNENDRGRVRRFMDSLNAWAGAHQCTVLLVAHPSKSAQDATELSGNTDWRGAARFSLGLEPEPKPADIRKWDRKGADIPDLLRETCILEPGKGNYAPRGAVRGRYLRLPTDGRWETVDRNEVLNAKADVAESAKAAQPQSGPRKQVRRRAKSAANTGIEHTGAQGFLDDLEME